MILMKWTRRVYVKRMAWSRDRVGDGLKDESRGAAVAVCVLQMQNGYPHRMVARLDGRVTLLVTLILLVGAACSREAEQQHAEPPPSGTTVPGVSPTGWMVTMQGIGPLRAGMNVTQASAALGAVIPPPPPDSSACAERLVPGAPGRVSMMIVGGNVVRIDVLDSLVATAEGARVGDSEARIHMLYGDRLSVQPSKYTSGNYLVVLPRVSDEAEHRLVFETDGRRVTRYRAGLQPQVEWVEGCS
jgi:hypothetical protein